MSYFADHYSAFRYPLRGNDGEPGLRTAQLGAIHAIAAHFSIRHEPAVVTMPTGSGKTAVLLAAAFVLQAKRVLILTPSRLVREQISEEAAKLATLRDTGAIGTDVPAPRVFSTRRRVTSAEAWEAMRDFDIVVGTVPSLSPEYDGIPEPPADLFDLVLVDEAHHSPARTWQSTLDHLATARRVLFTATPFRQDQREIQGRFIFTYDLRDAFREGIFGEIRYVPVRPAAGQTSDAAIARAAEAQVEADRAEGFVHHLMVRTDSLVRAEALAEVYAAETGLRLNIVTGSRSLRFVRKVIADLESGELDGIICVNMLGEGFNFPSLKVAAIHSPHKSLSVTLQFIGRFARTTGINLGPATFLAVPSEIKIETERLYDARAVWQEVVQNLSAARVGEEAATRELLQSFAPPVVAVEDLSDLSLYTLEPYYHVKVYQLTSAVDFTFPVIFPPPLETVYQTVSEAHNAAIYITREISLPRWTDDDRLSIVTPDLFIFFQEPKSNLLFICASRRVDGLYAQLVQSFAAVDPRPLSLVRINRALNDLGQPEFFNVGMRNRVAGNTTESYRIVTGSNADKTIAKSDARLYHRGHVFGRATEAGVKVTLGLSSASKLWSNRSSRLPGLIDWCTTLAGRISSGRNVATGSGLDNLGVGEEVDVLPSGIIAAAWPVSLYQRPPIAEVLNGRGQTESVQLLDFDLSIDPARSTANAVMLVLSHECGVTFSATYSFATDRFFEPGNAADPPITVTRDRESVPLIEFLNGEMPWFYTSDLSLIDGYTLLRPAEQDYSFDDRALEARDWTAANVDITREFGPGRGARISVHEGLANELLSGAATVIYYDHGTGEMADFITFETVGEQLLIRLYHCKGATGGAPGHRVGDVYEIAGQAVKSVIWALKQRVLSHIARRFTHSIGSHEFIRGDLTQLEALLDMITPAQIEFEFVAVQPGLAKAGLPSGIANVLGAASDHLVRGGFRPLRVLGSQ